MTLSYMLNTFKVLTHTLHYILYDIGLGSQLQKQT